jgi:ACS family hexuronate transporter-like MFS transporter
MMLVTVINYVDRNTLAILAPTILRDTNLSAEQYGFIISCFSVAYMAGNPLWGRGLDRYGVRGGIPVAVAIWTVASVAHAWASTFLTFAIARAVLGAGEAATFPGAVRTVTQTLALSKRGRGLAIAYSGSALGAIIAPLIVVPVALRFGWHGAFFFTGIIGVMWLVFWGVVSKDIDGGIDFTAHKIPWSSPALWGFIALYGMGTAPLAIISYYASLYLTSRFHWSQVTLGQVLWIPPAGTQAGFIFWGWIVDRFGSHHASRLMLAPILLAIPFAWANVMPTGSMVLASMFLMMSVVAGVTILALADATRRFPTHSGLLGGLGGGAFGAVTALVMPIFGRLFDHGDYDTSFRLVAAFPFVGYALWRMSCSYAPNKLREG